MKRVLVSILLSVFVGCDRPKGEDDHGHDHPPETRPAKGQSNRIDLPATVRENLGITFAKVERRRVAATIRVPGRFELLPLARREHRAPLAGRVEIVVKQLDRVEAGTVLYRIDSPEWQRVRVGLAEAQGKVGQARAQLVVAERSRAEAEQAAAALRKRIGDLAEAQVRRAELEAELARHVASIPRFEAEIGARRAELAAAEQHVPLLMAAAASSAGVTAAQLNEEVDDGGSKAPRWRTMDVIEARAAGPGVVEGFGVTNGAWVEASAAVLTVVDPSALRFRATALQADLGRLREGAAAAIVPPLAARQPGGADPMIGKVVLGLEASADTRTVDLLVMPEKPAAWARAGVSAFAEVVTDASAEEALAIPEAAVVQDELARVYYRRDPADPDKVIRVEGDFGVSDGRWVVVESGVKAGDEVVLAGVYELKLTGGGKQMGKGHFHADGTWHAEEDDHGGGKK